MRFLIQVVTQSEVRIANEVKGKIGRGSLVFIGIGKEDTKEIADKMIAKLLLVSQFTLYADVRHGNRPGFTNAGAPQEARELYEYIIERCREQVSTVETGVFGADMKVLLTNDGPFTILLDSEEILPKKAK